MTFRLVAQLECDGALLVADKQFAARSILGVLGGGGHGGQVHTSLALAVRPGRWAIMALDTELILACHSDGLFEAADAATLRPIGVMLLIRGPVVFRAGDDEVPVELGVLSPPSSALGANAATPLAASDGVTEEVRALEPHARVLVDDLEDTTVVAIFLGDA